MVTATGSGVCFCVCARSITEDKLNLLLVKTSTIAEVSPESATDNIYIIVVADWYKIA